MFNDRKEKAIRDNNNGIHIADFPHRGELSALYKIQGAVGSDVVQQTKA